MRPFLNIVVYTPFVGNFVFVRLVDLKVYIVWMGRAENDVIRDQENENYRKVYVQWWVLAKKGAKNDEELYHNCWLSSGRVFMQTQNNGSKSIVFHFIFQLEAI
jgi:hypothetical protein